MQTAQQWRERMGQQRSLEWDEMIDKLSPLASNKEGLYLAAETAIRLLRAILYFPLRTPQSTKGMETLTDTHTIS